MPLGVTGNTSDSGSEESWFEPRRGNCKALCHFGDAAPLAFRGCGDLGMRPVSSPLCTGAARRFVAGDTTIDGTRYVGRSRSTRSRSPTGWSSRSPASNRRQLTVRGRIRRHRCREGGPTDCTAGATGGRATALLPEGRESDAQRLVRRRRWHAHAREASPRPNCPRAVFPSALGHERATGDRCRSFTRATTFCSVHFSSVPFTSVLFYSLISLLKLWLSTTMPHNDGSCAVR